MANIYDRGDMVRLEAAFTDINGDAADPSSVTLRIRQPDGTIAVHTGDLTQDGTGAYHYDLYVAEAGDWYYRFEGSGAVTTAAEGLFHARKSDVI